MSSLKNVKRIDITLSDRLSIIQIGAGILEDITAYIPFDLARRKIFIVTDDAVRPLVAQAIADKITNACESVTMFSCPSGEQTKSFAQYQSLISFLLDHKIDRHSVIFAVGGGVIGDLAGFAAATILRGVRLVQVPTTLLAQVDSSVGGKNGINTTHGKNLVGCFYQPDIVLIDPQTLATLPAREFSAGYAEIYKYGLILDSDFAAWLEARRGDILAQDPETLTQAIMHSCKMKADIVQADEREEKDIRALLNLGHTFGHALEALSNYNGTLLHGEAVAIGMVLAMRLSMALKLVTQADVDRVVNHLQSVNLPVSIQAVAGLNAPVDQIISKMYADKKAQDGALTFIICEKIGKAVVRRDVPESLVRSIF